MPLQNRVTPFGHFVSDPARGLFMGNRGGRIHDDVQRLGARRWASKQWICCKLEFKGRQRRVWSDSYTELFFLDEITALAAGHRPCFECRRADALAFAAAWQRAYGRRMTAAQMDAILHAERLVGRDKRVGQSHFSHLPDGAMITMDGFAFAVKGDSLLPWSPSRYRAPLACPQGKATILTPPSVLAVLLAGYRPHWHPSAKRA